MYEPSQLHDRCHGAFLAGEICNAIGAPFEGSARNCWLDLKRSQHDGPPLREILHGYRREMSGFSVCRCAPCQQWVALRRPTDAPAHHLWHERV